MSPHRGVAIFGDEIGIPVAIRQLGEAWPACIVIDPRRQHVKTWVADNRETFRIVDYPDKPDMAPFLSMLADMGVQLGVCCSFSRIFPPELMAVFPNGMVNVHGGKLPEYRGANVLQWAIINGDEETAVTLHYMDEGVDTGPVIAERRVMIEEDDTAFTLRSRMSEEAEGLLAEWLPKLLAGRVDATRQDESRGRVWPRRKPEDGRVDWSWPDEKIRNLTRALVPPWPGAFYRDRAGTKVVLNRVPSLEEVRVLRREVAT